MDNEWLRRYNGKARREDLSDHAVGHWTKEGFEELLKVTDSILDSLKDVSSAIDVGCGSGNYCNLMQEKGFDVLGVDYSEEMIKRASLKYPKIKFETGNGYSLKYPDKSFDLAISIGAVTCLSDYKQFVFELMRVSKKYVILSTLLRKRKVKDINLYLKKKLEKDSWPTMDYHPSELSVLFEKEFDLEIITHYKGKLISDGFFIVAKRKKQ